MSLEKKILDRIAKDKRKMGGDLAYWMDSRIILEELGKVAREIEKMFKHTYDDIMVNSTRFYQLPPSKWVGYLKLKEEKILGLLVEQETKK